MRIGFASADWSLDFLDAQGYPTPGGAGWYRCHLPANALRDNGFEVVIGSSPFPGPKDELGVRTWDNKVHRDLDILVIQRWMHEMAPVLIRRARASGQVIIQDVDDWFGGLRPSNAAWINVHPRSGLGMNRAQAREAGIRGTTDVNVNHYNRAIAASSAVTVSTPYLAERIRSQPGMASVPIYVLRNAIDFDRWGSLYRKATDHPTLGWVGGTSHRSGDLEVLRGYVGPYVQRHGLKFHHAGHLPGASTAAELLRIDEGQFNWRPMCSIADYPRMFKGLDISLVPLSYTPFNEGKSAIKGMESILAGVPFVATATTEYQWLKETYGVGRLARRGRHWIGHLDALLDPEVRQEEAQKGREALQPLDIKNRWADWLKVYLEVLAGTASL